MSLSKQWPAAATIGLLIWACASGEEPGDGDRGGGGRAGATATAGRGGTVFTAGNSAGGAPGAGNPGTGGAAASSGAPGMAGESAGGSGGTIGVPPDVLERASVVLYYSPEAPTDNTSRIFMRMFLENRSADPLPLASVTVRYWMTSEPAAPRLEHFHTGASISGQSEQFVEAGDDSYVEVAFLGGSVPRGADLSATEFQLQITGGDFDQTDDYSYQPAFAAMRQPHDKITVYLAERLIWGCEPSGTCPSGGSGGAGGEGGGGVAGAAGGDTGEAGAGLGGAGGAP